MYSQYHVALTMCRTLFSGFYVLIHFLITVLSDGYYCNHPHLQMSKPRYRGK